LKELRVSVGQSLGRGGRLLLGFGCLAREMRAESLPDRLGLNCDLEQRIGYRVVVEAERYAANARDKRLDGVVERVDVVQRIVTDAM
jgi:hypothetical protein